MEQRSAQPLTGKRVAFVVANEGVEQVELTRPWRAINDAGGQTELIAPRDGNAQAFNHLDKGSRFPVDTTTADADCERYQAVILPGGVANPDQLRQDAPAVNFVRQLFDRGRPVGAICHGPWTLIEAGVLEGRTLTSWPSLRTDLVNAGARWIDEDVVVDGNLVTSRRPADLDAFCRAVVAAVSSSS